MKRAKHGGTHSREYAMWWAIKQACLNPKNPRYPKFGGRGITICSEWMEDFPKFIKETGERPSLRHTLALIDERMGFVRGNTKWILWRERHGKTDDSLYGTWDCMKQRCYNPNSSSYSDYGARGIIMCERWRTSFTAFRSDMGPRPTPRHTVDRINNDGPYAPDNCRWATYAEQNRNNRGNRIVTFDGLSMPLCDWATRLGKPHATLYYRLFRYGWSVERALTT